MYAYQCDKAVNKNDTREVIWCHFTEWNDIISLYGFELSNQIDCNNLVRPIGLHVIFQLKPGVKLAGRIALQFYQRFLVLQLIGLIFFKHVICNKQIIIC